MKKITEKQKTFIQNLLSKIDPEHLAKIQELKNIKV